MVVTSFAEPPLRMDVHSAQLFRDFLWMHLILTLLRASGFGVASRGFGEEGIRVRVARFILTLLLARWCRTTCRPTDKGHDKNTLIVRKERTCNTETSRPLGHVAAFVALQSIAVMLAKAPAATLPTQHLKFPVGKVV